MMLEKDQSILVLRISLASKYAAKGLFVLAIPYLIAEF